MTGNTYLVCGQRPWSRYAFDLVIGDRPGWQYTTMLEWLETRDPRYVFFLHWSDMVPARITEKVECVQFHMADLPKGRGGSPLQNHISEGRHETMLTAFRMTQELDAGPFYMKWPLSLEGSAEEVYLRSERKACLMALMIAEQEMKPLAQHGESIVFKRRTPAESLIPAGLSLEQLHDHIRMLDADGYPHAFIEHEGFRFEFTRASLRTGHLDADVRITRV